MLRRLWQLIRGSEPTAPLNMQTGSPFYPPHPANVPGPFYVEGGCCLACGVPEDIAPDLFGWVEGDMHCYVKRQPETPKELDRMREAMCSSEVDCIRARSCSPEFLLDLARAGHAHLVDTPS